MKVAMLALAQLTTAQAQLPHTAPNSGRNAELSSDLARHDYIALSKTIRTPAKASDTRSDLDWLQARLLEGNTALVAVLYAQALWAISGSTPRAESDQLRQTAVFSLIHAYAATTTDGARCGDPTAPSHRRDQLVRLLPGLPQFLTSLSQAQRDRIVSAALLLDSRTAARRDQTGDVDFLCRDGLEETQYNITHGSQREVPTPPGMIGKTIELSGDGQYRPSVSPESKWRPAASAARGRLRETLMSLITPRPAVGRPGTTPLPAETPQPPIVVAPR